MSLPKWIEELENDFHIQSYQETLALKAFEIAWEALDMTTGFAVDFRENQSDWEKHPEVGKLFAYIDSVKRRIEELGK